MLKQILTGVALAFMASGVSAQHVHDGDIDSVLESGTIEIENGILLTSGKVVFESEFGTELGADPWETDAPGFVLDDGSFASGEFLAYEATGTLQFWDGIAWGSTTETLTIVDNAAATANTLITSLGVTNALGYIDAADPEGGVHTHIPSFSVDEFAASGAYLIEMALRGFSDAALTNGIYNPSDSFFIAFNYGMDEELFEAGIDALGVAAVPVPAAGLLMASALGCMTVLRRAKK